MDRPRRDTPQDFRVRYRLGADPTLLAIEREVLGTDYGVTGYTTVAEARRLGAALSLGPGDRLLDVGCGAGWPGLFLADEAGCEVVLSDLPLEGLTRGMARAGADGVAGAAVVARGEQLPLAQASVDAVVSVDALC